MMLVRLSIACCVLLAVAVAGSPLAGQQINPVIRTFRPDPNWNTKQNLRPAGELILVDQRIADPAAFIAANRCLVGRWHFDRKLDTGYFGYLTYANANDDERGVRRQSGPYRVVLPEGAKADLNLQPPQWSDVVVLRALPGSTYHELVAYSGVPEEGTRWLPRAIANNGKPFWGGDEYAFRE